MMLGRALVALVFDESDTEDEDTDNAELAKPRFAFRPGFVR
ncbi:MAG: hypothetical protein ACRDRO_06515 [Pseudonocardiaceae bacterium]